MTLTERMEVLDNLNQMWTAFAGIANPYCDTAVIMAMVQAKDRIHSILAQDEKDVLLEVKGALAALSQNKTFLADIEAAKLFLTSAISKSEREE